jgi:hypothetical protein
MSYPNCHGVIMTLILSLKEGHEGNKSAIIRETETTISSTSDHQTDVNNSTHTVYTNIAIPLDFLQNKFLLLMADTNEVTMHNK